MTSAPADWAAETRRVLEENPDLPRAAQAALLGIKTRQLQIRIAHHMKDLSKPIGAQPSGVVEPLPELPVFPDDDMPPENLIDTLCTRFDRRYAADKAKEWFTIKMPDDRPFALACFGDPHLDSNGCNWPRLRADCKTVADTPGMYGLDVGDVVDGWGTRLMRLYAHSDQSTETAWRLVDWFYNHSGVQFLVRILGNHDQMRMDVPEVLKRICKNNVPVFADEAKFVLKTPNGFEAPVWCRHQFSGNSMWNRLHGMQKAAMMKQAAGLYICGHIHTWALHHEENAERGFVYWLARARGYKFIDDYAKRLGFAEQQYGATIVAVYNPQAESEPARLQCYADVQQAAEYLTWLRERYQ